MPDIDTFMLMREWKRQKKGELGPTLPFLVGAKALKSKLPQVTIEDVRAELDLIVANPPQQDFALVAWCPNIRAPVLSVQSRSELGYHTNQPSLRCPRSNRVSLLFGKNIVFRWGVSDIQELVDRFVTDANEFASKGLFSRNPSSGGGDHFEYTPFQRGDITFICDVLGIECPADQQST